MCGGHGSDKRTPVVVWERHDLCQSKCSRSLAGRCIKRWQPREGCHLPPATDSKVQNYRDSGTCCCSLIAKIYPALLHFRYLRAEDPGCGPRVTRWADTDRNDSPVIWLEKVAMTCWNNFLLLSRSHSWSWLKLYLSLASHQDNFKFGARMNISWHESTIVPPEELVWTWQWKRLTSPATRPLCVVFKDTPRQVCPSAHCNIHQRLLPQQKPWARGHLPLKSPPHDCISGEA